MTESEMDEAIDEVRTLMQEKASTDNMTQAEAIDFYRAVSHEALNWVQIIESEME